MKSKQSKWMALTAIAVLLGWLSPARAADRNFISAATTSAQAAPINRDVLDACVQNRAETLPNPFTDVPANHWAYKAVLTLYYCGPYRQATPRSLIERSTSPSSGQQSQFPAQQSSTD